MFRRKRSHADDEVELDSDDLEADQSEDEPAPAEPLAAPAVRPTGPWDVDDAPEDDVQRIDLGALQVPVPPDTEVRVDVNADGAVVAATLARAGSSMQVNVFAAPRTDGIWDDVRAEILTALVAGGGQADELEGAWGTELRAAVPTEAGLPAPARFLGVDGPRWFVRALVTGPAALEPAEAAPLEEAFRSMIVVRGGVAMAVRDPLPLTLPVQVTAQADAVAGVVDGPPGDEADSLSMPARGPEITERR